MDEQMRDIARALAERIGGTLEEAEALIGQAPQGAPLDPAAFEAQAKRQALLDRLNQRYRGALLLGTRDASVMIRIDPEVPTGEVHLADSERRVVGKIVNVHRGRRAEPLPLAGANDER